MVHPALHKLTIDRSECEARPGMMWAARARDGDEGMLMVHMCVECTRLPLGRWAMMGLVVGTMLVAGMLVIRMWLVAPELRMAHCLMVLALVLIVFNRTEAAKAATHKSAKAHSSTIMSMQGQLQAMQQFCMVLQQQQLPPPTYAPQQQHRGRRGSLSRNDPGGAGRGYPATAYQQPTMVQHHLQPSTPFKRFNNWNYCSTHGGDIHNTHTSGMCRHPGPSHNPSATRANRMGGSTAGLHKTILPSATGCAC